MKKFLFAILAVVIMLSLTACNNGNDNSTENQTPPETGETTDGGQNVTTQQYAVGDIILADGTAVKANSYSALDNGNLPVAVIALLKADGGAIGVGVHRSKECLRFEAQSADERTASDYVAEYGATYQISGEYASGWRLPEVEELKTVYANRNTINTSLQKIYRLDNNAAMNGLSNVWYWTGTPATTKKDCTWFVHFVNGYAGECERDMTNLNAMAVRTFNNG